jgi:dTDP-4-amino-4,6-dideoxy-D-galactose acyltransferase
MNRDETLNPNCHHLVWDSHFWGFPVGKLDNTLLQVGDEDRVLEWCQTNEIRCLYFAAEGSDAETLQRAHGAGFQYMDVRMDLECDAPAGSVEAPSDLPVRPVAETDLEALKAIARRAHYDSRFFKDLNFDRSKCAKLYEKWIERDFESGQVLGFFPNNRAEAGGYLSFARESGEIARIGLIAVEESLRGLGAGRMLLDAAMSAAVELGAKKIRVATQGTNVSALKLYEKAGFRVCDVKIWFHRWFPVRGVTAHKILTTDL